MQRRRSPSVRVDDTAPGEASGVTWFGGPRYRTGAGAYRFRCALVR